MTKRLKKTVVEAKASASRGDPNDFRTQDNEFIPGEFRVVSSDLLFGEDLRELCSTIGDCRLDLRASGLEFDEGLLVIEGHAQRCVVNPEVVHYKLKLNGNAKLNFTKRNGTIVQLEAEGLRVYFAQDLLSIF